MPKWAIIFCSTAILVAFTGLGIMLFCEDNYGGSISAFWYASKADQTKHIPRGYRLLYNSQKGHYTVQDSTEYGWEYINFHQRGGRYSAFGEPYNTFKDSVKAKSFLFDYIRFKRDKRAYQNSWINQ